MYGGGEKGGNFLYKFISNVINIYYIYNTTIIIEYDQRKICFKYINENSYNNNNNNLSVMYITMSVIIYICRIVKIGLSLNSWLNLDGSLMKAICQI
jgi:hypothetical protein